MPALQQAQYGIENLYLFPCYMTQDEYRRAAGKEPPTWDPTKPPKYWEDPNAKSSTKRTILYERAIVLDAKGVYMAEPDGKPLVDMLALVKDEAATVNIPVAGWGAVQPYTPCPMRALESNEELVFAAGNVPVVRNKDIFNAVVSGYTAQDRALLQAIAKKLGV